MQNPDELFDVVDNNDQIIGQQPRSVVHAQGLFHRAVHILVFNKKDEVLLQLRSSTKDRHPNTWDSSAAGHVDAGEDYLTAASREFAEELGTEASGGLKKLGKLEACEATGQEFIEVFSTIHEGPFKPCEKEIDELKWISKSDLETWMQQKPEEFAPALPFLWKHFMEN
ncbi:MAG: NUDIX domain-containing protein [Verrucomicrobiota bacterium]